MSATLNDADAPINLRELYAEARRQWWIDSGVQAQCERDLYEALCSLIEDAET
jgi:hypothetical protein